MPCPGYPSPSVHHLSGEDTMAFAMPSPCAQPLPFVPVDAQPSGSMQGPTLAQQPMHRLCEQSLAQDYPVGAELGAFSSGQQFQMHKYWEDHQITCIEPAPAHSQQDIPVAQPSQSVAMPKSEEPPAVTKPESEPKKEVFRTVIRPTKDDDLPFKLAAIRLADGDHVLAAHVLEGTVEWEWSRAVAAVGMKTKKDSQFLKRNRDVQSSELIAAAISQSQLMYNGEGSKTSPNAHCMNSSAFLLLLLLISSSRQIAPVAKKNALALVIGLLQVGVKVLSSAETILGQAYVKGSGYLFEPLFVDSSGIVGGLYTLLQKYPAAMWAWGHLMNNAFCSTKITSSASMPTLWDFVILLIWSQNHPATKSIWKNFGQLVWPPGLVVMW